MEQLKRFAKELEHLERAHKAGIIVKDEFLKSKRRIEKKMEDIARGASDEDKKKKIISDIINNPKEDAIGVKIAKKRKKNVKTVKIVLKANQKGNNLNKEIRGDKTSENAINENAIKTGLPQLKEHQRSGNDVHRDGIFGNLGNGADKSNFWSYVFLILLAALVLFFVYKSGMNNIPTSKTITIYEFSDFECSHCRDVQPTLKQLKKDYASSINIIHKNFPLEPMHKDARFAAEAAECAAEQGKFLRMHNLLYEFIGRFTSEDMKAYAAKIDSFDKDSFMECIANHEKAAVVQEDIDFGMEMGVEVIPTFFIDSEKLVGNQPIEVFTEVINRHLKS